MHSQFQIKILLMQNLIIKTVLQLAKAEPVLHWPYVVLCKHGFQLKYNLYGLHKKFDLEGICIANNNFVSTRQLVEINVKSKICGFHFKTEFVLITEPNSDKD